MFTVKIQKSKFQHRSITALLPGDFHHAYPFSGIFFNGAASVKVQSGKFKRCGGIARSRGGNTLFIQRICRFGYKLQPGAVDLRLCRFMSGQGG